MNYFTCVDALDLGSGFVLLVLQHDYGKGPDVRIPIAGDVSDFPAGRRIEVTAMPIIEGNANDEQPELLPAVREIAASLPEEAKLEFGPLEALNLSRSFEAVGMECYPDVTGDPNGERASQDCICARCNNPYGMHPNDWRVIGYGNVPFLTILCDGRRVKL